MTCRAGERPAQHLAVRPAQRQRAPRAPEAGRAGVARTAGPAYSPGSQPQRGGAGEKRAQQRERAGSEQRNGDLLRRSDHHHRVGVEHEHVVVTERLAAGGPAPQVAGTVDERSGGRTVGASRPCIVVARFVGVDRDPVRGPRVERGAAGNRHRIVVQRLADQCAGGHLGREGGNLEEVRIGRHAACIGEQPEREAFGRVGIVGAVVGALPRDLSQRAARQRDELVGNLLAGVRIGTPFTGFDAHLLVQDRGAGRETGQRQRACGADGCHSSTHTPSFAPFAASGNAIGHESAATR